MASSDDEFDMEKTSKLYKRPYSKAETSKHEITCTVPGSSKDKAVEYIESPKKKVPRNDCGEKGDKKNDIRTYFKKAAPPKTQAPVPSTSGNPSHVPSTSKKDDEKARYDEIVQAVKPFLRPYYEDGKIDKETYKNARHNAVKSLQNEFGKERGEIPLSVAREHVERHLGMKPGTLRDTAPPETQSPVPTSHVPSTSKEADEKARYEESDKENRDPNVTFPPYLEIKHKGLTGELETAKLLKKHVGKARSVRYNGKNLTLQEFIREALPEDQRESVRLSAHDRGTFVWDSERKKYVPPWNLVTVNNESGIDELLWKFQKRFQVRHFIIPPSNISTLCLLMSLPRFRVIWGQRCPRVAASLCLPIGPFTQLSP